MPENTNLEITTTRVFNTPPELVWRAWTDPDKIPEWWGPTGFSVTMGQMDFTPGGEWHLTMHGPDGTDYPNRKTFLEIILNERIVMAQSGPLEHIMTVTFKPRDAGTLLTIHHQFKTQTDYDIAIHQHHAAEGATQTLNRFASAIDD